MTDYKPTRFTLETSHYDESKANLAVNFIQSLNHTKGKWFGKPFLLMEWQEQIIRDIFGIVKENGKRQFSTAYIEIPKKQGKSELAAGVALKLLCADGEQRAEIYSCAADTDQARLVFDVAVDMVRQNKTLSKKCEIKKSTKEIIFKPTNSRYKVLSADAPTKHGLNTSGLIFDELHAQKTRELYDTMTAGAGDARDQPLFFVITTAGNNTHTVCYEKHQYAVDILQGRKYDPTFYPVIYGLEQGADWSDEENWKKCNPSLGVTVDIEKVREHFNRAKQDPSEENSFRQLRLNQWVAQAVRWMPTEKWKACEAEYEADSLIGRPCYGGLDLSSTSDITAFALVFPPAEDGEPYKTLIYFWIPEETVALRVRRDHVKYDVWARQGFILTTEGEVIYYGFIEKFIEDLSKKFEIKEIAFDRWGATQMVQDLDEMGLTVVQFGQGFKDMSPPSKELMRMVIGKEIVHNGNPVLSWMMENVYMRKDPAGNIKPDKEKSTEKIDGVVALIMALDRALKSEDGNEVGADSLFFL